MQDNSAGKHHIKMKGIKTLGLCLFFVGIVAVSAVFIRYIWISVMEAEKEAIQLAVAVESGVILLLLYLIILGYYLAISRNQALKREKVTLAEVDAKMKENIKLFRSVFNQAPIGIAIGDGEKYTVAEIEGLPGINPMFEKILGRGKEELAEARWTELTHPDDLEKDLDYFKSFRQGEIPGYSMVKRYIRPDGSFAWINMTIAELNLDNESVNGNKHLCLIEDISERIRTEEALRESERSKAVLLSHLQGMAYRCSYDMNWTMEFVSDGCYDLTGYQPSSLLYNRDLSFNDLIAPEYRGILWSEWSRILELRIPFRYEYEIISAANERKWVLELGQGIYDEDGKVEALEGIVIDISEGKKRAAQIQYMSDHDFMTGLYNRRFFEDMMGKYASQEDSLPLTIIVASINGMRLINDAFGHAEGDLLITETAKIIQNCCRKGDIPARIGGDEFGILMPMADEEEAHLVMDKIEKVCDKQSRSNKNRLYDISLTTGYCVRKVITEDIEAVLKAAEEYMYKRKLLNQKSSHSALLSSVMTTMYEKSQETEEHSERIAKLSKTIGSRMQLPQKSLDDLQLLSMLHDIGKVGIDDRILKKPGKLNEEEWRIMKKHPEIGYRITMSSPELEHIAQYILSHHERWDGKGYPHGLKGDEIPLLSRILSLVDAYDAMTEDRVYRKALSREEALEEITANSGTQFDPEIVKIFIEII